LIEVSSQHLSGSRDIRKEFTSIRSLTHVGMASRSRSAVCEPNCGSVEGTELDTQELGGGSWTRVDEREAGMQQCEHFLQLASRTPV
jgi:hypothetical protein